VKLLFLTSVRGDNAPNDSVNTPSVNCPDLKCFRSGEPTVKLPEGECYKFPVPNTTPGQVIYARECYDAEDRSGNTANNNVK